MFVFGSSISVALGGAVLLLRFLVKGRARCVKNSRLGIAGHNWRRATEHALRDRQGCPNFGALFTGFI